MVQSTGDNFPGGGGCVASLVSGSPPPDPQNSFSPRSTVLTPTELEQRLNDSSRMASELKRDLRWLL